MGFEPLRRRRSLSKDPDRVASPRNVLDDLTKDARVPKPETVSYVQ